MAPAGLTYHRYDPQPPELGDEERQRGMMDLEWARFNTGKNAQMDEAALCQLGAAAALNWHMLPDEVQDELLSLTGRIAGIPGDKADAARIKGLIERNTNLSL